MVSRHGLEARATPIARVESREKIERDRPRKFRRGPKPAFFVVETPRKLFVGHLEKLIVDLGSAFRLRILRLPEGLHNLGSLLGDFFVVLLPGGRDPLENFRKTGLTVSIFRRKISASDKRFQIGRKPDTH